MKKNLMIIGLICLLLGGCGSTSEKTITSFEEDQKIIKQKVSDLETQLPIEKSKSTKDNCKKEYCYTYNDNILQITKEGKLIKKKLLKEDTEFKISEKNKSYEKGFIFDINGKDVKFDF